MDPYIKTQTLMLLSGGRPLSISQIETSLQDLPLDCSICHQIGQISDYINALKAIGLVSDQNCSFQLIAPNVFDSSDHIRYRLLSDEPIVTRLIVSSNYEPIAARTRSASRGVKRNSDHEERKRRQRRCRK